MHLVKKKGLIRELINNSGFAMLSRRFDQSPLVSTRFQFKTSPRLCYLGQPVDESPSVSNHYSLKTQRFERKRSGCGGPSRRRHPKTNEGRRSGGSSRVISFSRFLFFLLLPRNSCQPSHHHLPFHQHPFEYRSFVQTSSSPTTILHPQF